MQQRQWTWLTALAVAGAMVAPASVFAQGMEQAEQQTEQAGENLGEAAETTAEQAGQETEQGLQEFGQETEQGLQETGQEMEQAGREMESELQQQTDELDRAAQTAELSLPAGIQPKQTENAQAAREPIREVTKAALVEDGFDDLVERLVDEDRNRIGQQIDELDRQALNARTLSLREAWKAKYGQELDISETVLENVQVVTGEITDPQQIAGRWPVAATGAAEAMPAGLQQPGIQEERDEDANLEQGREVALAQVQASGKQPLTVSLVDEAFGWKIDIPNDINTQRLYQGVASNLGQLDNNQQAWPEDVNEAQRLLAYHVIAGLYAQPAQMQQGQPMPGEQRIEELRQELQQQQQPGQPGMQQEPQVQPLPPQPRLGEPEQLPQQDEQLPEQDQQLEQQDQMGQ